MKLSNLSPAKGSVKSSKRIGRGPGSGLGGTSTRGHKGDQSRSGYKIKLGFEGGQMPLQRRVPKFGFKNFNRIEYKAINLDTIQALVDAKGITSIGFEELYANGLVSKTDRVKLLGRGTLNAKVNLRLHAVSNHAKGVVEANGGTIEVVK